MAKKSEILNLLVSTLEASTGARVYRRLKFLDQVNDFPTICLDASPVDRSHEEFTVLRDTIDIDLRAYIHSENVISACDNLIHTIEIGLMNLVDTKIEMIRVMSIDTDEGLFEPYGVITMRVRLQYDNNN
jgi:hypothetical protein